ncbi:chromosome partitioning protein ParA [Brevibacillus agri]|nr:chromosome partitioning protein ParA [Brevibacillus agri]
MVKIAVSTNKGGVLKTSITTNLAGVFAKEGKKVLIVDTDNQGNCYVSFGGNPDTLKSSIYDVLVNGHEIDKAIVKVHENIDLLPANDDMAFFEFDVLADRNKFPKPFSLMQSHLKTIEDRYDCILFDTPPNLGLVQGNVLSYVDNVLIPFQPESYSMRSLIKIIKAINDFKEQTNKQLSILGVVATLVDSRTTLHSEIITECRKYCLQQNIKMFDVVIPRSVRFASSVAFERLPATLSADAKSQIVHNYFELYEEIKELL